MERPELKRAYGHGLPETVTGPPHPGLEYFCTTRRGGHSEGERASLNLGLNTGDKPLRVQRNRDLLSARLGAEPLWLKQVHGVDVLDADLPGLDPSRALEFDAAVTTRPGRVLAILTADCLPVVLWDEETTVLGAAHAGWRGLQAGILARTWERMREHRPQAVRWHAWIGPAISQPCFEVGREVRDAFLQRNARWDEFFLPAATAGKWLADLAGMAAHQLRDISAGAVQIHLSGHCTFRQDELFFSYRRSPLTGRQATIARLTETQGRNTGVSG